MKIYDLLNENKHWDTITINTPNCSLSVEYSEPSGLKIEFFFDSSEERDNAIIKIWKNLDDIKLYIRRT